MKHSLRLLIAAAAAAALLPGSAPASQQDDGVYVDEIPKEFLDKVARYREAQDWRSLFQSYELAQVKYRQKLVKADESKDTYVGVVTHLNELFATLPKEALEYYRMENDGKALTAWGDARNRGDLAGMQDVVERWFYSSVTGEALDTLGNLHFHAGRNEQALYYWSRLLEHYPDSTLPKPVTAARAAMAAAAAGNHIALDRLKALVAKAKLDGPIVAGGRKTTLAAWLAGVEIPAPVARAAAMREPVAISPEERFERQVIGVRNDVKRYEYDFASEQAAPGTPRPPRRVPRGIPQPATVQPEFPIVPSYGIVEGREYVVFTDGSRVVALNPQKVAPQSASAGVYWRFPKSGEPPIKRRSNPGAEGFMITSPFTGATIDGSQVFVTLFSEKRPPLGQVMGGMQDSFDGPSRIACLNALNSEVVWDTDMPRIQEQLKKLEFFDRNWAFSAPPVVRGDSVFAAICSSPLGEPESRLICFDRRTGDVRWHTFLVSVNGGMRGWWGGGGRLVTYLTLLIEEGGVLYAHTNLGAVAAVNPVSGQILWLTRYPRSGQQVDQWRGTVQQFLRYASAPVIHRGRLYCLPMDQAEMQVFALGTGAREPFVQTSTGFDKRELPWRTTTQLVGVMEDWMIVGGAETFVINMVDRMDERDPTRVRTKAGRAYALPRSDVSRSGLAAIDGETIYLPTSDDTLGTLAIYHGLGSFKNLDTIKWQDTGENGNLLVAEDYLVVAGPRKVMIYTDTATIRKEFVRRLAQSPPNARAHLEFGDIMRQNGQLVEAAESYLAFVEAAKGDPRWEKKIRDVKTELHDIFMQRGEEAFAQSFAQQAVDYFRMAKGFSYDDETFANATRRLGESYEKAAAASKDEKERKELARRAVQEYQELVEKGRDAWHRPEGSDIFQKVWAYASDRIRELGRAYGDEVLEPVEKAAREQLDQVAKEGGDALRKVIDFYPRTKAAAEAYVKMIEDYVAKAEWRKALSALKEFKEKYPDRWSADLQKKVTDALEKLGDWRRLFDELKKFGEEFGGTSLQMDDRTITVAEYVGARLESVRSKLERARPLLADPMREVGRLPGSLAAQGTGAQPELPLPLRVEGPEPPSYTASRVLVSRGSAVELWDLERAQKVWTAAHPGPWLGFQYRDVKGGADPGAEVIEVFKDSPAARAELKVGDIVTHVGGRAVDSANLDVVAGQASAPIQLRGLRSGKTFELTLAGEGWPAWARPAVVGAAFTSDYGIVVVWEDAAAWFDAETGQPGWVFRNLRDRFTLRAFGVLNGRLLLHEHFRVDRPRGAMRQMTAAMRGDGNLPEEDAFSRVMCLSDSTGEVAWARAFRFDPATAVYHRVEFHAPPAAEEIVVLAEAVNQNVRTFAIRRLGLEDGQERGGAQQVQTNVLAWVADPATGAFYYVDGAGGMLRTLRMWPPASDTDAPAMIDLQLRGRHMDQSAGAAGLAMSSRHLVLVVPPYQATSGQKVVVFNRKTGKEAATLELSERRSLPLQSGAIAAVGEDGVLYLYLVPHNRVVNPSGDRRRAFLAAWRIVEEQKGGRLEPLWEAVAPWINAPAGVDAAILPLDHFVVLYSSRGSLPGDSSDSIMSAVYSKRDDGYLRSVFRDLSPLADPAREKWRPLLVDRGRLFVVRRDSLEIHGN